MRTVIISPVDPSPVLAYYGKTSLDPSKMTPIQNGESFKPLGGLWSSPVDSRYGWADWCHGEDYPLAPVKSLFKLKAGTKVVLIDSSEDLHLLPFNKRGDLDFDAKPDFEAISKLADVIWLTADGQDATRFSTPYSLYGWDCESLLIFRPESIEEIHPEDEEDDDPF